MTDRFGEGGDKENARPIRRTSGGMIGQASLGMFRDGLGIGWRAMRQTSSGGASDAPWPIKKTDFFGGRWGPDDRPVWGGRGQGERADN